MCIQIQDLISCYRGIYLINNSFNNTFGKLCMPLFKMTLVLAFVTSVFAFVRLYQHLGVLSFILVTGIMSTVPLLVIPMSIVMSSLYDISSKFNRNISIRTHRIGANQNRKRVLEGQLKSCLLIRCQVGNFYYMEAQAKLTLVHNVLNGIVFLMVNAK